MKDFLGIQICVGDRVVYCKYNKTNACLCNAVVEGLTPKQVRIAYDNYGKRLTTVEPYKLVVVNNCA